MKNILDLARRNWLFFLLATLAALALRFFFVLRFPHLSGDTWIYGDIARNWLQHGTYALSDGQQLRPTLIRLPGYPGFLALMFSLFGMEHYGAVLIAQALIDTNTCLVIAALALELMNERAAKAAYLLAALCPFTAIYTAAPLSETLAICCAAHALFYGVRGLKQLEAGGAAGLPWLAAGLWTAAGILLRPDGALVLAAFGFGLVILLFRSGNRRRVVVAGGLVLAAGLAPLIPWTVRNWRTFHLFQPLAPRYANDPGEFVTDGFNHWVKTWTVDFVSVEEVQWRVSGEPLDLGSLPERAFDSYREYQSTAALFREYNQQNFDLDAGLDGQFERLAQERVSDNPFRYYVWLPFLRIADMWLRPRTELLPIETRWWEFSNHPGESAFALVLAGINLFYLAAAFRGWLNWKLGVSGAMLIGWVLLRSAFLGTLENPEPRYVLECFAVVLALAGGAFAGRSSNQPNQRGHSFREQTKIPAGRG